MSLLCVGMVNFFVSLKYLPTLRATLVFNLGPIFVSILSVLFLGERITQKDSVCIIGAFFGVFLIMITKSDLIGVEASYLRQMIALIQAIVS